MNKKISAKRQWISRILLVFVALSLAIVPFYFFHDLFTLTILLAGAGLALVSRGWRKWVLAGLFASFGLYWSSWDVSGCSLWWRLSTVASKSLGYQPHLAWADVANLAFTSDHCYFPEGKDRWVGESIQLLREEQIDGHPFRQYETRLGKLWAAEEAADTLAWLVWEIAVYGAYEQLSMQVKKGDVVIDCGAHVGVYTRYALNKGATRVISIEPNPANIQCLERNFAKEIAAGRVTLIKAGVWNKKSDLELNVHSHVAARSSLVKTNKTWKDFEKVVVPVLPLDDIVEDLDLNQVDVIKMDIEGAERFALKGAQKTIERFKPRMAVCTYHLEDDPEVVPTLALRAYPDYEIHAKGISIDQGHVQPKVLLFN